MQLAKVVGSVVSTHKSDLLIGLKLLLLEKMDAGTATPQKDYIIAIDSVEAGAGDVVFYVTGSSARMTDNTKNKPTDATIIAIVDSIDKDNEYVYQRGKES
jgi:microcompartment protein CcmK/EutM